MPDPILTLWPAAAQHLRRAADHLDRVGAAVSAARPHVAETDLRDGMAELARGLTLLGANTPEPGLMGGM